MENNCTKNSVTFESVKELIESVSTLTAGYHSDRFESYIDNAIEKASKRTHQSQDLNELFAALAKAQGEMAVSGLHNENPYFKNRYASLADIVKASRPVLAKNGLCVTQQLLAGDDGQLMLRTLLGHSSGQWMETKVRISPAKNDVQALGSYITYMRRYSYAALVGVVAADEDDDGERAMVEAREIIAKGPALQPKYDPREQSFETITREQLEMLEYELQEAPDLAEEVLEKMRLQSLADMPKSKFGAAMERIRDIKLKRKGIK